MAIRTWTSEGLCAVCGRVSTIYQTEYTAEDAEGHGPPSDYTTSVCEYEHPQQVGLPPVPTH